MSLGKFIPRFYPVEYAFTLVTSLVTLFASSLLASLLVNYWLDSTPSVWADLNILTVLSVLIVVLPVHLIMYVRVRRTDKSELTRFSQRAASAFLAIYLFVTVATVISLTVWLLALWLNAYLGSGSVGTQLYAATWSLLFAIGLFKYSTWHFLRTRGDSLRAQPYAAVTGILGIGLILLSFAYPVPAYRDAARDFAKEADLLHIQQAVGRYVDEHEKLPDGLNALEGLDESTVKRLDDYSYTPHGDTVLGVFGYQLCANFATSGHDFGFSPHKAGRQCEAHVAISGPDLEQGLASYVVDVEDGAAKLHQGIARFLQGAKTEVQGIESSLGGQLGQLEQYLEGVEGGSQALQREMQRLEKDILGSAGVSGKLVGDFSDLEKFLHDLICGLDPKCNP